MIEPAPHERDFHVIAVAPQLGSRRGDVLAVLLAARIGMLGGGDEADGAAQACRAEIAQRVWKQRMPVAHPDVDGKRMAGCLEAGPQALCLPTGNGGDRRDAVEELVVARDLLDALGADAPAAKHIGEKRTDVVRPLRPAERDDEYGIKRCARQPYSA